MITVYFRSRIKTVQQPHKAIIYNLTKAAT